MKKILFVIGSLRKQSFNRQLSEYVKAQLEGKVEIADLKFDDLPWVDQDIEFPAPAPLERVRKEVMDANLIWVFSPEYNASYPGLVKNLFDWLSRSMIQGDLQGPTAIRGHKVVLSGIGGRNETKDCREKLTSLLDFIGAQVMENQVGLCVNMEAWATNEVVLSDEQKALLDKQVKDALDFIK